MNSFKWPYKTLRALALCVLALAVILPTGLYVAVTLPFVQNKIARIAENELTGLLTVPVKIGKVDIVPFNRLVLRDVEVYDSLGERALNVQRIGAGISLKDYLLRGNVLITYGEISGMDVHLYKLSPKSPLNIQPIINALKPKDRTKPPTVFDIQLKTLVIRSSSFTYDVRSEEKKKEGFDPNHISVSDFKADLKLPRIANDDFTVDVSRLSLIEKSGISIKSLSGLFHITPKEASISHFGVSSNFSHLTFADMKVSYGSYEGIGKLWKEIPVDIHLLAGSYVSTKDLEVFLPVLAGINESFQLELQASGTRDATAVNICKVSSPMGLDLNLSGEAMNILNPRNLSVDIPSLGLKVNSPRMLQLIDGFVSMPKEVTTIGSNLGEVDIQACVKGSLGLGEIKGQIKSACGSVDLNTEYDLRNAKCIKGNIAVENFNGSRLMGTMTGPLAFIGNLSAISSYDISFVDNKPEGKATVDIADIVFKNHHFYDISASGEAHGDTYKLSLYMDNPGVMVDMDGNVTVDGPEKHIYLNLAARDVEPALFGIDTNHPERKFSIFCIGEFSGKDIDHINGQLDIDDLQYGTEGKMMCLQDLDVQVVNSDGINKVNVSSDVADGCIEGVFRFSALPRICAETLTDVLPALLGTKEEMADINRNTDYFNLDLTLKDTEPIEPIIKLPVNIIHPVKISGSLDAATRSLELNMDAPYLQQGNKLIENSSLRARFNGANREVDSVPGSGEIYLSTVMPTKKGPLTVVVNAYSYLDQIDTEINWNVLTDREISGDIRFSSKFSRQSPGALNTRVDFNEGRLVFNDTVWNVNPSYVEISNTVAKVHDFRVYRDNQFLTINGNASKSPSDTLVLQLEDVHLDYVFETLNIPVAMFGGNATGVFYATDLFSGSPKAFTHGLKVKSLKYNNSLLGDALIKSSWQPVSKAITINADITQSDGRHSFVDGSIKPTVDSLDLRFKADKLNIGFLLPFMSAFATDISGYASGDAHLYGSFKLIDMTGDVYGEDVTLALGFTNTSYSTTDSVHFRPGRIDLPNLTIADMYGNKAKLNGWVKHEFFKSPSFEFRVTDAKNLLVYDVKESSDQRWYGKIFGSGIASVTGRPGVVDISADIRTEPNSTFTFVLSDELSAQEYNFISFRDRDQARKDSLARANALPPEIMKIKQRMAASNPESAPSRYNINIGVDVTSQAQVTLVMDPAGGDKIRAYGSGNMRMMYDSSNEDLRLTGTYTVERGKYNFTLQDIIIKDFTIKNGSSITFNGNPYAAQLDIAASYSVNANISDLDESFLYDKELNRTNVPVNAMLLVKGDMRHPDTDFDLEFPTLTEDTDRKIRSIINTTEMMNKQIIYLLALNRFYTPEYMTTTKGNELVSMASSTLSSQLSNMLSQITDKFSVAPNIRSDRGDFSDLEVDVALSSHLLNNRLLLNGNLGYRDKALNNNSFIGDFDLEYLLNRRGTIRLKAYNRYNDQNYYVKTALTTQGVGVMFKRDFDNALSFLRPFWKKAEINKLSDTTSTQTTVKDSLP